jgi:hypothetical protein
VTAQEKLKREIHVPGLTIAANVSTLETKTIADDRDLFQRQMTMRVAHLRLLQQGSIVSQNSHGTCGHARPAEQRKLGSGQCGASIRTPPALETISDNTSSL